MIFRFFYSEIIRKYFDFKKYFQNLKIANLKNDWQYSEKVFLKLVEYRMNKSNSMFQKILHTFLIESVMYVIIISLEVSKNN